MSKTRQAVRWYILAKEHIKAYNAVRQGEKELLKEFNQGLKDVTCYLVNYFARHPGVQVDSEFGLIKGGRKKPKAQKLDLVTSEAIFLAALSKASGKVMTPEELRELEEAVRASLASKVPAVDEEDPMQRINIKLSKNKKKHAVPEIDMTAKNFNHKLLELLTNRPDIDLMEESDDEDDEEEKKDEFVVPEDLEDPEGVEAPEKKEKVYEDDEEPGDVIKEDKKRSRLKRRRVLEAARSVKPIVLGRKKVRR